MRVNLLFKYLFSAISAGVFLSLGAYVYLSVQGVSGAVLLSIGFILTYYYNSLAYTTCANKVSNLFEAIASLVILLLNICGCAIVAGMVSNTAIINACQGIIDQRASLSFWEAIIRGVGCGIIVNTIVQTWEDKYAWPAILIGVPAFMLAGFNHCILDAFFYLTDIKDITWNAIWAFAGTVFGNYIGCKIWRLGTIRIRKQHDKPGRAA